MKSVIPSNWQPSDDAIQQLAQIGVDKEFALSLVLEFRIYWSERGYEHHAWSSKFAKHVMHEWRRHQVMLARGLATIAMHSHWRPSQEAMRILACNQIPEAFILSLLPEFRLYWIDAGEVTNTWNSKFLGHVRYKWQTGHSWKAAHQPRPATSTRNSPILDNSWANGIPLSEVDNHGKK